MKIGNNGIRFAFRCMSIAEDEIGEYKTRHPDLAERAHKSFPWLFPGGLLMGKSEDLYRAHARELIDRVANGQDPVPLTRAEVLSVLSHQSSDAPLSKQWAALMTRLFKELELGQVETVPEAWDGSSDELLQELRRKHAGISSRAGVVIG